MVTKETPETNDRSAFVSVKTKVIMGCRGNGICSVAKCNCEFPLHQAKVSKNCYSVSLLCKLLRMESIQRQITEAEDIADVFALMVNLNIETKGCKNLEQMQERIYMHLNTRRDHLDRNKVSVKCRLGVSNYNLLEILSRSKLQNMCLRPFRKELARSTY